MITANALTWRALVRSAEEKVGMPDARHIVERAWGHDRSALLRKLDDRVPSRAVAFVDAMVERRAAGEPLQYVLGRWGFRTLDLLVDRRVLIPRPETETVVDVALGELTKLRQLSSPAKDAPRIVDLGTGSGAIALSLAGEVPGAEVWATDRSPAAVAVARANLAGAGSQVATRVRLAVGSWFDALPMELEGRVDLIVSNPPYVATVESLPAEVGDWEPHEALYSGPTGLEAVDEIIAASPQWLARPGALVIEVAPHLGNGAAGTAREAGFSEVELLPDLAGRIRALVGRFTS